MNKRTLAFLYNLIGFGIVFIPVRYLVLEQYYIQITLLKPLIAFVIATIIAPKFQAVRTAQGENIYMKWIFMNGVKKF